MHYEILVNGRFVDPMRIKLPRGRVLDGPMLAGFDKERDRVDGIMTRSSPRVAAQALRTRRARCAHASYFAVMALRSASG